MIITKLLIENFGLFRGRHILDLRPKQSNGQNKPIILIGGKNGAGKTTLFEAIRVCLYGAGTEDFQLRRGLYEKYIEERIHQIIGLPIRMDMAQVEIELEYSNLGIKDNYKITRKWERQKSKINEYLIVEKNGKPITDIEPSDYQNFINELIPPGISRLFFFDGEKIQNLAEDTRDNIHLKDSFKSLLGIQLVEQLDIDLNIYKARLDKELNFKSPIHDSNNLSAEISQIEDQISIKQQEKAQKYSIYQQISGEIERLEMMIAKEGGSFASRRGELKLILAKLEKEIEFEKNHIRDIISGLFPFAIVPKYCLKLKERIEKEEAYQQWNNAETLYIKRIKQIEKTIQQEDFWREVKINNSDKYNVIEKISLLFQSSFTVPEKFKNFTPVHQLSPLDQKKILQGIDLAINQIPEQIKNSSRNLERLTQERLMIEKKLNMAPDDDVISPYIHELNIKSKELGQLEEQIKIIDDEIHRLEFRIKESRREQDISEKRQKNLDAKHQQIVLAEKVQDILKEFTIELQKVKTRELGQEFLACFNKLLHKRNTIKGIDIDINDFSIKLHGKGGGLISKEKLSVGEKQIYAIAMLWALTIVSKRPIPFIIDTPLGRLDSDHRINLVTGFFPQASHQIIILSTDTEIDLQYFKDLEPYISKSYHLEYDEEESMTTISSGYFWKTAQHEVLT